MRKKSMQRAWAIVVAVLVVCAFVLTWLRIV